jgi:hypothetical protein
MNRARLALLWVAAASVLLLAAAPAALAASGVARAIDVPQLLNAKTATARDALLDQITTRLGAKFLRVQLYWPSAEPRRGVFSSTYLARIKRVTDGAKARGMTVMVTCSHTPRWASNRTFWKNPPGGYRPGHYYAMYAMSRKYLPDFKTFAEHTAAYLGASVDSFECWNEPNLWAFIYPQKTISDPKYAAHLYVAMLQSFSAGIKVGNSAALVVAGATAPIGFGNKYSTSPQHFARVLKAHGAAAYFDIYSHHPYTPGASRNRAPSAPPDDPTTTVTLGNLGTLIDLFPGKPFYLTEYGYNTSFTIGFGGLTVSMITQARYLKAAYAYAARYPQVKALFWYRLNDFSPTNRYSSSLGVYCGLRTLKGVAKRSWFAFAGGNTLTIAGPGSTKVNVGFVLKGTLTCASVGTLRGKTLVVQRRFPGGRWRTVAHATTGAGGAYKAGVRESSAATWRVNWQGVVVSPTLAVPLT